MPELDNLYSPLKIKKNRQKRQKYDLTSFFENTSPLKASTDLKTATNGQQTLTVKEASLIIFLSFGSL